MKKLLSLLLCLALLLSLTPAAFADDAPEDDGPEYGWIDPGDDPGYGWEDPVYDEPWEEPVAEEQTVTVSFICDPSWAVVTVYQYAYGGWNPVCTVTGGICLLLPGDYAYDASCAGYSACYKVPFGAYAAEETVYVELYPDEQSALTEEGEELPRREEEPEPLSVEPVAPDPNRRTPTVFLQEDGRWGNTLYYYSNSDSAGALAATGCGPLALTNAVYYLNGCFIDPVLAADYAASEGFHTRGGTKWDFYRSFAEAKGTAYGIRFAGEAESYADLKAMLQEDCVAICSVPGHVMAIVDYDESLDRFLLLDSSPDDVRATGEGFVWISEQELCRLPSVPYDFDGLILRFVLLRAVGILEVGGLLDGVPSDSVDGYGTFDLWLDGKKAAEDQSFYSAVLPRGTSYRIDDIQTVGAHRYYGVAGGALEGKLPSGVRTETVLRFGTRDFVSAPSAAPKAEPALPAVCARWVGGILGPFLSLP